MATVEQPQAAPPPHNLDAEQSVLGAILLSDRTMYGLIIEDGLAPEDFYREQHRIVFRAMLDLYNEGSSIDTITLVDKLRLGGRLAEAGGEAGVDALAGSVPAVGNLRQYAQIVKETSLLRRLLGAAFEIQSSVRGHEAAPRDLLARAEKTMFEIALDDRQRDFRHVHDVLLTEIDKLQELSRQRQPITGTPSGFGDLDEITGGFQEGNLIIIAARPSMGKSALVTNMAENAALGAGKPVALFSLEMAESELAQRFVASQAAVPGDDLRKGRVADTKWPGILEASQRLSESPLYVDDTSDLGVLEVRAKARRLHNLCQPQGGLGLIIIDYLQLMRPDGRTENRVEQVGQMSRGLKILAGELQVPVIALSQLNRGVEGRTDKRPLLSDLRESGSIEQDADLVMFIYRDEYYHPDDTETPGEAELIIAKHRNGGLGTVHLAFKKTYPKFLNLAKGERYGA